MNQPKGAERRTLPRFKIDQMVEYRVGGESFLSGKAVDFSLGGFRCETEVSMESGGRLFIMFRPGDQGEPISAEAVVLHSAKHGSKYMNGCQFTDLDETNKARLAFILEGKPKV